VLQKFDRFNFRVGPHKAFQFARELVRIRVILLSELPAELVRRLFLIPASTPEEALEAAFELLPAAPSVAILPRAINTIPLVEPFEG
jgi:nickel-dependent lactate racemase